MEDYAPDFGGADMNMAKQAIGGGRLLRRVSHRERYEAMRQELKARLNEVENAIAALDAHPELEKFIEVLGRVGL